MRQIHKALQEVFDDPTRRGVAKAFLYLYRNQPLLTTTISTGANIYFTTAAASLYIVDGVTISLPAATQVGTGATGGNNSLFGFNVPATGANIGVFGYAVDKFANIYTFFNPGQTFSQIGQVIWPTPPDSKDGVVVVGYGILTNSTTLFTGGTSLTNQAGTSWQFIYEVDGIYQMNNFGQT